MKLKVYTKDGSSFAEQEFENIPQFEGDKGLFALKETIVAYQANARQGNASTLDYGHVSGTCRKPFKQKGGGRSRHGTMKSPIHRGGAVVFGPHPRDWSKKINRKAKVLAFARALFDKCVEGGLCVIEAFEASEKKTKSVVKVLSNINPTGKVLLIDDMFDDNFVLASRNIERVNFCESATLSALELVQFENVIVSRKGLDTVLARINKD
ncbi:MAG: 50S ribosomal protein L4 [Verrucomicrobiaceae bacterium]|nr:50S ribosomal protein L4 [Verrucomicrobiaceae bacterium]